ncbi:EF-hand domain-containing protein [Yunchengibacter salinarum]|uniref:EF-hand domain-containing protein n=1 Tax=Yunchengibacter salinarum TaxID=3133399 RepID=UPI0035B60DF2
MPLPKAALGGCALMLAACGGGEETNPAFAERHESIYDQVVANWDQNGDLKITCADMELKRTTLFDRLDRNEDQLLGTDEYGRVSFYDKAFMFHSFSKADQDNSGSLSLDEFMALPHSRFASMDEDGNCRISKEEAIRYVKGEEQRGNKQKKPQRPGATLPRGSGAGLPQRRR